MRQYGDEGLARGDRVLVCYSNNPEFFIDLLAVRHSGAGLVPIDRRLTAFAVENLARVARPRFTLAWSRGFRVAEDLLLNGRYTVARKSSS